MKREAEFLVSGTHFKSVQNKDCEFWMCHKNIKEEDFNCLFCYCPLTFMECPGPYKKFTDKFGVTRKDCSDCGLNHNKLEVSWNFIQHWLNLNMEIRGNNTVEEKTSRMMEKQKNRLQDIKIL
jgi:Zn-finger protein